MRAKWRILESKYCLPIRNHLDLLERQSQIPFFFSFSFSSAVVVSISIEFKQHLLSILVGCELSAEAARILIT